MKSSASEPGLIFLLKGLNTTFGAHFAALPLVSSVFSCVRAVVTFVDTVGKKVSLPVKSTLVYKRIKLTPLPESRADECARACFDSVASTGLTRLASQTVYLLLEG